MARTKYEYHRINEALIKEGKPTITWKQFLSPEGKAARGRPRIPEEMKAHNQKPRKRFYNFDPEPQPVRIQRPPAVYNNASYKNVFEKYGV